MPRNIDALVVEGGGMRGVFAAGVLDAFSEKGFDPFRTYYGVSAGACNLASHLAGQYRRNYRCFTDYMLRPEFISLAKFLSGGHFMDLDWFWDYADEHDMLDKKRVTTLEGKKFFIVATDVDTGEPLYLEAESDTIDDILKGSSAVPVMYRNFINISGRRIVDGGVADSIPVVEAWRRGAKRIMVIRTRPSSYRKKSFLESRIIPLLFSKYPHLKKALREREVKYMEAVNFINNPPAGVEITEIAPDRLFSGRTTRERSIVEKDYMHGHDKGLAVLSAMK